MAWTELLPSGKYRAMYRDHMGKRKSAGTYVRKNQALGKAVAAEDEARSRPASSSMTWGEWEAIWTPQRKVQLSTLERDNSRIKLHVRPKWEDVPLSAITTPALQAWIDKDLKGFSPSTQRNLKAIMGASLRAAVQRGLIPLNPCQSLSMPSLNPSPERWLSVDEVDAIREVLDDKYRLVFELLVGTGMRWGEAVALHWDDVDLKAKEIHVRMSWDRKNLFFKATKTRGTRTIPIDSRLEKLLNTTLDRDGLGSRPDKEYQGVATPRFGLVLAPSGNPLEATSFAHGLTAAGRAAFVTEGRHQKRVGKVRPHDLRHTYASHLVQRGISITTVSALLGHSTIVTTQRYAQTGKSEWDSVRSALG
ncbi:tyrosine-type recombinase/integrase [Gordonia sp. CPCC 206044]|uniref:tyrosine-type recombinase/integrase n=1 Tax=Gordonia sp. CPCC 206044 TaxID=3140793 RepID=UPI003AF3F2D7